MYNNNKMEVIDLGSLDSITMNIGETRQTNFGGGIELLMNDKNKSSSSSTRIDLGELDNLEDELNELSGMNMTPAPAPPPAPSNKSSGGGYFGFGKTDTSADANDSKLGGATVESIGNTKTWDGFSKLNEVPLGGGGGSAGANLNEREKRRKKRVMIKSLEQWHEKGLVKNISHFTMESTYEEVEDEYEGALEDKRKRDAIKIQQNWLITAINTIEYGNAMFDPFGISLDGWGESISEDIDSYDEIFEQLHEKYKGGKMSPELSLLMRLGFSASVIHFSNKALSTAAPGFNDVIKQSPELMRMFTNATVDSMKQTAPGMAFASELLNSNKPTTMNRPPPAPVETRNFAPPPASARPGMQFTQNRPDIDAGRGAMFREQGIDISNTAAETQPRSTRPEMTGPRNMDIDNILSGLKTKNVNISNDDDSLVSLSSLNDVNGTAMPKKSARRRNRSDKNVISLDI
jgi:hypothetical protein